MFATSGAAFYGKGVRGGKSWMDIQSSCPNTTEITVVWSGPLSQLVTKQKTVQAKPTLT